MIVHADAADRSFRLERAAEAGRLRISVGGPDRQRGRVSQIDIETFRLDRPMLRKAVLEAATEDPPCNDLALRRRDGGRARKIGGEVRKRDAVLYAGDRGSARGVDHARP